MTKPTHTMYRIETKGGVGMYRGSEVSWSMMDTNGSHPGPWDDSLLSKGMRDIGAKYLNVPQDYVFGFSDLNQLRNWIYKNKWLQSLHDEGLILTIMEVEDYVIGHTQAIFRKTENYTQHSIAEYFKLNTEN